jgi:type IV secretion system protein VirD4
VTWGPSHQHRRAPRDHGLRRTAILIATLLAFWVLWSWRLSHAHSGSALGWAARMVLELGLLVVGARYSPVVVRPLVRSLRARRAERVVAPVAVRVAADPARAAREHVLALGGGAFLGCELGGGWIVADREHAVLVLGPPRSGKTSAIVIPALLSCAGAAVSTSTKLDVLYATCAARAGLGQVWLFDPAGCMPDLPDGVRRLSWSPVRAASSWDGALLIARAMAAAAPVGRGMQFEQHWSERAAALLAPLLHAAHLSQRPVSTVLRWVLRGELDPAGQVLEAHEQRVACDVLFGIANTEERERSSIFSATAGVLSAYNADSVRASAAKPDFDPAEFVNSTDTVYIAAPAHRQALCAPLVVGLLEEIRHATYALHARGGAEMRPVFMALDEVANIAPIGDLPALISEAGGQGLHVLCCLQDLSQARERWGEAAEGLLTLFQSKLILSGVADPRTLEGVSLMLGEYDRQVVSYTAGLSRTGTFGKPTSSDSVTYATTRQRTLSPGEIARLPAGRVLLLRGAAWSLLRLTPWFASRPWPEIAGPAARQSIRAAAPRARVRGAQPGAPSGHRALPAVGGLR